MIVRDDIPLGFTHDANGQVLTYKNSDGYWREHTYDAKGRELTYKNSDGYWYEYTRDSKGLALTRKDSHGFWSEHTYDAEGRVLTYKKEGFSGVRIAESRFTLYHDAERDLFLAGCRGPLTRAKALKHWDRGDERAKLFTKAIQLGG